MMTLYVIPGAPNCRKVRAVALYLGVEMDTVTLDLRNSEANKPGYLALNPNGYTPTLVDGDFVLWESNAIAQYLCDQRPGNLLLPNDPAVRADIARWQFWEQANLQRAASTFLRENFLKPRYFNQEPDVTLLGEVTAPFHRYASILDQHLRDRRYIAGDGLTLADLTLAAAFCYAVPSRLPWDGYANIQAWYARIDALPAWQATAPKRAA